MWPFGVFGGIFKQILNFLEIELVEAQGEFREKKIILVYASTLPTDTLLKINFLVLLWDCYVTGRAVLAQDNRSEKGESARNLSFMVKKLKEVRKICWNSPSISSWNRSIRKDTFCTAREGDYGGLQRKEAICPHRWRARRTYGLCDLISLLGLILLVPPFYQIGKSRLHLIR